MQRLKLQGFTDWAMQHWTFANDHGQNPQMQLAQRYVAHWPEMREKNVGLLLWGGVGTGKSFMAGCIANALMEQEVAVCMTNFARIMNELNNAFSGRNEVVDRLCGYPLLVIDDFGMERGTEYALEEIIRNALTAQIKQAEYVLEILHERERKALICFSALERQEEKLSAEKAEIVKQRVALYEQYADGNMSKEEFIRQRDAYRVQEDEKMEQIQRLRTEKNQAFQPVKRDTDHLQTVMSTVEEAGDVMYLSQNVVETFIDRIEVFNDEHVKIHFTFENVLADYAE